MHHDLNNAPRKLLTRGNPKTAKGEKQGILTAIMHLAPHKLGGVGNICPHATTGCALACLNTAGRGGIGLDADGMNAIQVARIRRTRYWKNHKIEFNAMLHREIRNFVRYAKRHGFDPAIRLNGTSDIPWEKFEFCGHDNVFAAFPDVQFYDYTKWPIGMRGTIPANYHLTYSLAESNAHHAADALARGHNVAAVFRTAKSKPLQSPYNFRGRYRRVIDGDATDARFTDTGGAIIGLRAKGRAKHDTTGFVLG